MPLASVDVVNKPDLVFRGGEGEDLVALHRSFGALLLERSQGSSLTLLTGDPRLRKSLRLRAAELTPITSGGLACEIVHVQSIADTR